MSYWPYLIVLFLMADFAFAIGLVMFFLRRSWVPLHEAFPPHPPAEDAVSRRFQSFRLGLLNLGFSVHVAADERHLHLAPARILRRLGARAMSIPWDEIRIVGSPIPRRWLVVEIRGRRVAGPAWCLELAGPSGVGGGDDGSK